MGSISKFLDGRKTYLLSGLLLLGVVALVFMGRLQPSTALPLGVVACFAFGFRKTLQAHHDQVLTLLAAIAGAGVAARTHNKQAEIDNLMQAAEQGAALAKEGNS